MTQAQSELLQDTKLLIMDSLRKQTKKNLSALANFQSENEPLRISKSVSFVPSAPAGQARDLKRVVRTERNGYSQESFFWRKRIKLVFFLCLMIGAPLYGMLAWQRAQVLIRSGNTGYAEILLATEALKGKQFQIANGDFHQSSNAFRDAHTALSLFPGWLVESVRFIPGLSRAASGRSALLAGEHIARAGIIMTDVAIDMTEESVAGSPPTSLLEKLQKVQGPLADAGKELGEAQRLFERVNVADIPEERRAQFVEAKTLLPVAVGALSAFQDREKILVELLGGNGPRKYLFLFQNNHELRATGGFIGSYALLNLHDGVMDQFFVDGIFNPDGQLKENIVPPQPIQKISAAWSLHDSNWYPDFPTSAEKAISFYEKTGGPTVDGVVTVTPTVMERLLEVLGPIDLPAYGVTIDAENFIPIVQEQVEEKYDKTENNPKKILSDLAVAMLARMSALDDRKTLFGLAEALVRGLNEKHILLYARHAETEGLIDQTGWSGKLLPTEKDFLSVVHSNINGYKTDGVIDERIAHRSLIAADGSVIDTVSVTRQHNGGNTPYVWWNKVNADYLRVYVPLGAELLSVKGTTWEFPKEPLYYTALGFQRDAGVEHEESNARIHEGSGTRISEENGKTVFGAWVYVSPGESVTVEFSYRLPFHIDPDRLRSGQAERFSVLYQKQSGSLGSKLHSEILFPEHWKSVWQTGGDLIPYGRRLVFDGDLAIDHFIGTALMRE